MDATKIQEIDNNIKKINSDISEIKKKHKVKISKLIEKKEKLSIRKNMFVTKMIEGIPTEKVIEALTVLKKK